MIRPATPADVPAVRRLMESVPGFWQRTWTDATVMTAIEAAGGLAFVWDDSGEIIGFLCGHDLGFRAYLSELVVADSARRRGIGRALLDRFESSLRAKGQHTLIADVWRDAVWFYQALGWQPPDVVLLRRRLNSV